MPALVHRWRQQRQRSMAHLAAARSPPHPAPSPSAATSRPKTHLAVTAMAPKCPPSAVSPDVVPPLCFGPRRRRRTPPATTSDAQTTRRRRPRPRRRRRTHRPLFRRCRFWNPLLIPYTYVSPARRRRRVNLAIFFVRRQTKSWDRPYLGRSNSYASTEHTVSLSVPTSAHR